MTGKTPASARKQQAGAASHVASITAVRRAVVWVGFVTLHGSTLFMVYQGGVFAVVFAAALQVMLLVALNDLPERGEARRGR